MATNVMFFRLTKQSTRPLPRRTTRHKRIIRLPKQILLRTTRRDGTPKHVHLQRARHLDRANTFHINRQPTTRHVRYVNKNNYGIKGLRLQYHQIRNLRSKFRHYTRNLTLPLKPTRPRPLYQYNRNFMGTRLLTRRTILGTIQRVSLLYRRSVTININRGTHLKQYAKGFTLHGTRRRRVIQHIRARFTHTYRRRNVRHLQSIPGIQETRRRTRRILVFYGNRALPTRRINRLIRRLRRRIPLTNHFLYHQSTPNDTSNFRRHYLLLFYARLFRTRVRFPTSLFNTTTPRLTTRFIRNYCRRLTNDLNVLRHFYVLVKRFVFTRTLKTFLGFYTPYHHVK